MSASFISATVEKLLSSVNVHMVYSLFLPRFMTFTEYTHLSSDLVGDTVILTEFSD